MTILKKFKDMLGLSSPKKIELEDNFPLVTEEFMNEHHDHPIYVKGGMIFASRTIPQDNVLMIRDMQFLFQSITKFSMNTLLNKTIIIEESNEDGSVYDYRAGVVLSFVLSFEMASQSHKPYQIVYTSFPDDTVKLIPLQWITRVSILSQSEATILKLIW